MRRKRKTPVPETGGEVTLNEENGFAAFEVIRTETVISRFPMHILAKGEDINISIEKYNTQGEVKILWCVTPSGYGMPRHLAYKLDTLIINKKLDELGRPVPPLIRLGSLSEMARELGLGRSTEKVKLALNQNAHLVINAQLSYIDKDGVEQDLELSTSRYGILFRGSKLPDGSRADAVYLVPHPIYREMLNLAPVRPLNYDYLKSLTPAAQRWYEILSYRFFAALQKKGTQAYITYSEYCAFAAQTRSYDWNVVRPQMYRIHKQHMASGYLADVEITPRRDSEGHADWLLTYTLGPQAVAEYQRFTAKPKKASAPPPDSFMTAKNITPPKSAATAKGLRAASPKPAATAKGSPRASRARRLPAAGADTVSPGSAASLVEVADSVAEPVLQALLEQGVMRLQAQNLVATLPPRPVAQRLRQIAYAASLVDAASTKFHNPAGFIYSFLQRDEIVPEGFLTVAEKASQAAVAERAEEVRRAREARRAELYFAYQDYREAICQEHWAGLSENERQGLTQAAYEELVGAHPQSRGLEWEHIQGAVWESLCQKLGPVAGLMDYETYRQRAEARDEE